MLHGADEGWWWLFDALWCLVNAVSCGRMKAGWGLLGVN